jgi:hypothetical protein
MPRKHKPKPPNVPVTDDGPVTGHQFLQLHRKLGMDLGRYLTRLGATMKDNFLINTHLDAPLADPSLALHVRLLDQFPELVAPDPRADDLLGALKEIAHNHPRLELPMAPSGRLVALLLGRNQTTATTWISRRATPPWKVVELLRDLLELIETQPDAARFLEHYCATVRQEAKGRGVEDLFTSRKWR